MSHKLWRYACFVCVGTGILFRFSFLTSSFEYDELFTAVTADPSLSVGWIWRNWLIIDVHPPLHNILLWLYNHIAPYGPEIWLRLPSVFFGLAALFLAWKLFPRRYGQTARVLFLVCLACNAHLVVYSQIARAYSLVLCLSVPLTFLFLDILRCIDKRRNISWRKWFLWGFLSVLLCWSHYFGALFFGVCSVVIAMQSLVKRHERKWALWVPILVLFSFLPWLLPNVWVNVSQSRFAGDWWGNSYVWEMAISELYAVLFGIGMSGVAVLLLVVLGCLYASYRTAKSSFCFPYMKDIAWLGCLLAGVFGIVGVFSLAIQLWIGRYFIVIVPALYLLMILSTVRWVKRSLILKIACLVYAISMLYYAVYLCYYFKYSLFLSARASAQYFLSQGKDKELFVISMTDFPPQSMVPMYSFYLHQIYGVPVKVTELYQLPEAEREQALLRKNQALIWMPTCDPKKLNQLSEEWERGIGIEVELGRSCFVKLADKGLDFDPSWQKKPYLVPLGAPNND